MLILLSGDVEVNPGPDSAEDTSFTCDDQSFTSFETLSNHLSVFHLNIQSLVPKIDIVRSEADAYDILVFSESWLNPNISNDKIHIENFMPPFRTESTASAGVSSYMYETVSHANGVQFENPRFRSSLGVALCKMQKKSKWVVFINHRTAQ